MTALCQHYLKKYEGMLSSLPRGEFCFEFEDEIDTTRFSELRKNLFELFAEAIRVLGDKDSMIFKRRCEELEESV